MSRVGFLKRLFTVFVLPALILAMVSFASAQEEKTDTADPSAAAASSQEKSSSGSRSAQASAYRKAEEAEFQVAEDRIKQDLQEVA